MPTSTTFSAPSLRSFLPPYTKILIPRIYFRVKTTHIDNQYHIYSITCAYESSMRGLVYFTVYYSPADGIRSICIIIAISYVEVLIIFVLDISNAFQNNILPNPEEIVYLRLTYLYRYWYKKRPKHQLALIKQK